MSRRVVGSEVGGDEEVGGVVWKGVVCRCTLVNSCGLGRKGQPNLLFVAFASGAVSAMGMMLSRRAVSLWNKPLFLTINFENSRMP